MILPGSRLKQTFLTLQPEHSCRDPAKTNSSPSLAIDGKTKRTLGKDHPLSNGDIIKIVSKS